MPTIQEVIMEFIEYTKKQRIKPYSQAVVKHTLDHLDKKQVRKKRQSYSLLEILETENEFDGLKDAPLNAHNIGWLNDAIEDSCRRAPSGKDAVYHIYQDFKKYIDEQYRVGVVLEKPELQGMTPLERRLTIIKILQNDPCTQEKLAEKFGVNRRIISDDLKILQGDADTKPLTIFGQLLKVEYSKERGVYSSSSSVHPIFLALNLSQIISILEGLHEMENYIQYSQFAKCSAQMIWKQLSDYAKEHILYENAVSLNLDQDWYKSLGNSESPMFYSERDCISNNKAEALVYYAKTHKKCCVRCKLSDGNVMEYKDYYISPNRDRETALLYKDNEFDCSSVKLEIRSILSMKEK